MTWTFIWEHLFRTDASNFQNWVTKLSSVSPTDNSPSIFHRKCLLFWSPFHQQGKSSTRKIRSYQTFSPKLCLCLPFRIFAVFHHVWSVTRSSINAESYGLKTTDQEVGYSGTVLFIDLVDYAFSGGDEGKTPQKMVANYNWRLCFLLILFMTKGLKLDDFKYFTKTHDKKIIVVKNCDKRVTTKLCY